MNPAPPVTKILTGQKGYLPIQSSHEPAFPQGFYRFTTYVRGHGWPHPSSDDVRTVAGGDPTGVPPAMSEGRMPERVRRQARQRQADTSEAPRMGGASIG